MSSGNEKICTLKNKIICRSVKSISSVHEVKNTMFSLKEDFVIVPIDKVANNVAFICKHFFALTIIKELNLGCHLSNQDDNNTYTFINNKTKDQIIKEHKLYLSKHKTNLSNNIQDLRVMHWISKMDKSSISFRFIIASPVCSIKPLSKDIKSIFKLFYEKVERYHTKGKVWSGIKAFWSIQNSYPLSSSINKLNKRRAAKSMSSFDFSALYTKIPHDQLLYVLNGITHFDFKGGTRDYVSVHNSGEAFCSRSKSKTGRSYSLQEVKSGLEFLINNNFFQVGSKIFRQVIGISMESDPALFFANPFLFFYKSRWLKSIENSNYGVARTFGNIFWFTDDLIAINDGNEFENHYNEIYPSELILKKENTSHTETTSLDLHVCINEGQFQTSLYDKRNSYNFKLLRFPYKSSNIPSKMFFATINAEILRICQAISSEAQFIKTSKAFLNRMLRQGADPLGVKKVLVKMVNRHGLQFEK